MADERLVTAREAAAQCGVAEATIRKWHARGLIQPEGRRGRAHLYDARAVQMVRLNDSRSTAVVRRQRHMEDAVLLAEGAVTTEKAAKLVYVSPSTIRMWVQRGHLAPIEPGRRPLRFAVEDVLAAAKARRDRALRN